MSNPTPLVEVDGIFVKLECVNSTGSIKDRIAKYILERSRELGLLKPGQPIVEATSGNTGIAMAHFGRELGHAVTIVMPENMTDERKERIRSLGANLVLCSEEGSFAEAAQIRDRLAEENGWFNPDQFSNPLNVECHRVGTGAELIAQAKGAKIEAFAAGIGTGGTLVGIGQALLAKWPDVQVAAVEPRESAVMSGGEPGSHIIFGIGDGFIPDIASDQKGGLHPIVDEVIVVSDQDALEAAHELREKYGFCVGISSGANFLAAKKLQERFHTVATAFADGYEKYESHGLIAAEQGRCPFEEVCRQRRAAL